MKTGDVISKDQMKAREEAIAQQIASEQEQLKNCFNIDYIELEQIVNSWDLERASQENTPDTVIDQNYIVVTDQTQKELIEDLKCSICLGLVRMPATMCGSCDKVFCKSCMQEYKSSQHDLSQSSFGGVPCPMCKQTYHEA